MIIILTWICFWPGGRSTKNLSCATYVNESGLLETNNSINNNGNVSDIVNTNETRKLCSITKYRGQ